MKKDLLEGDKDVALPQGKGEVITILVTQTEKCRCWANDPSETLVSRNVTSAISVILD